jgi:hypothetical protein
LTAWWDLYEKGPNGTDRQRHERDPQFFPFDQSSLLPGTILFVDTRWCGCRPINGPQEYLIGAQLAQRWPDKLSLSAEEAANWESELTELQITVGAPAEVVWDS